MMRALFVDGPETDRRWVTRIAPDPYIRGDTNDYSLDPNLVGTRVEVRISQALSTGTALDTGQVACAHRRSFARHRIITGLEHARSLQERREKPTGEPEVEIRLLAAYDALIA